MLHLVAGHWPEVMQLQLFAADSTAVDVAARVAVASAVVMASGGAAEPA